MLVRGGSPAQRGEGTQEIPGVAAGEFNTRELSSHAESTPGRPLEASPRGGALRALPFLPLWPVGAGVTWRADRGRLFIARLLAAAVAIRYSILLERGARREGLSTVTAPNEITPALR